MMEVSGKTNEGTKFRIWCQRYGRNVPTRQIENLMNADPQAGREHIQKEHPKLYRSMCSYMAGRGER